MEFEDRLKEILKEVLRTFNGKLEELDERLKAVEKKLGMLEE